MKSVLGLLIIALLAFASLGSAMGSWQNGEGWGYKWVTDNKSEYSNQTFNGAVTGKTVIGLYVEYNGEDNGLYNFSYIGSFYTYYTINGTLVLNNSTHLENIWHNSHGMYWISSQGYMLLEKCNITDSFGKEHTVYAIKEQYMHIYTQEPLIVDLDMYSNNTLYSYHARSNYTGSFNLVLKVFYSKPVAYIPVSSKDTMNYYSKVNFTGHLKATGKGYATIQNDEFHLNRTIDLNKTIDNDVSGSFSAMVRMDVDGSNVTRTAILEELPAEFTTMQGLLVNPDDYISLILRVLVRSTNQAHFNGEFYDSISIGNFVVGLNAHPSQSATKEEVKNIMTEAPQIYGPAEQQGYPTDIWIGIVVAIVVLAVVIIIGAKIKRKRGQRGTT